MGVWIGGASGLKALWRLGQIAIGGGGGEGECLPIPPKPKPHKAHSPILSGSLLSRVYDVPRLHIPYRGVLAS